MTVIRTVGDTAPALSGTINAATVGASAEVHVRRADPTGTTFSRAATTLDDNGDGTSAWTLALTAGDLTVSGSYAVEVEVTFSDTTKQTFGTDSTGRQVTFVVRQEIA